MNTIAVLILLIATAVTAEPVSLNQSEYLQQAIGGDLSLKMLMVDDGSPRGKCYCSCNLNSQPVFMELDAAALPAADLVTTATTN